MARIDRSSGGRPESDIGIAPRPIGKTAFSATRRVLVSMVVIAPGRFPRPGRRQTHSRRTAAAAASPERTAPSM